ncbi:MAG: DNA polymerase III subunit beta [Candidatus Moranbacteria bacterium RBG_13_45_13]|nr:MAG: DNA polymerase III subunit beta [Candidatus Moranbacteria bacterium RBG_13_45_13]
MKTLCTTENLKKGILAAEKIIGKNLTLPILSNILLEAEKGGLRVSATNLEIGLVAKIRAKVEEEGKIAIPGRIAGGILSQLEDGSKITLEKKNNSLKIAYNGNSALIKGMDAKDFPIIPKPQSKSLFGINALEIQKKGGNVLSCAAISDTRQELTGVYVEFFENKITLAATDSFRLAEAVIKINKNKNMEDFRKYLAKNKSVIIPARTLAEVIRSIGPDDTSIEIYLAENQIFFETTDTRFVSRLIDGKYPEYKQVVPKSFSVDIFLKKNDLLKAVRLAGIFSDSKSREVRFKIEGGKNRIVVFAESVEAGEGSWGVDCQLGAKSDMEIAFNNRFLLDGLNSLTTDEIYIGVNDSFGPVIFRESVEGKPKEDYFHIIMPIKS